MNKIQKIFAEAKNPLTIAARVMQLTDGKDYESGAGGGRIHRTTTHPVRFLYQLSSIVDATGTFVFPEKGNKCAAESFAISLALAKECDLAFELFSGIVSGSEDRLFINEKYNSSQNYPYVSEAYIDIRGILGYEGLYQFAKSARKRNERELAASLLRELVEKTPTESYPIRLQDIRVKSLELLGDLGVRAVSGGIWIKDELAAARAHQY